MKKIYVLPSILLGVFLFKCTQDQTNGIVQDSGNVNLDSVKILNFYQYSDFSEMGNILGSYKNLEYLGFWTPKTRIMENRPTDSLLWRFTNSSVKNLVISSHQFYFPDSCLNDTTLESLQVMCFNFHYGNCNFNMFSNLLELSLTTVDTIYSNSPIMLPPFIEKLSLGYHIKDIPQSVLQSTSIKHLSLLNMGINEFPLDLLNMKQLETLDIELTGIGRRLKKQDPQAMNQLRDFQVNMPNVEVIYN